MSPAFLRVFRARATSRGVLLTLRALGFAWILGICWYVRRHEVSPAVLTVLDYALFVVSTLLIGVMTLQLGVIYTPYAHGVYLVMAARVSFMADSLGRGARICAACVARFPLTIAVAAALDPAVRAYLGHGEHLVQVALPVLFAATAGAFFTILVPFQLIDLARKSAFRTAWTNIESALDRAEKVDLRDPKPQIYS